MGWDYLTPKSWRDYLDRGMGRYLGGVQQKVDTTLSSSWSLARASSAKILVSMGALLLAYAVSRIAAHLAPVASGATVLLLGLLYLFFITSGFLYLWTLLLPLTRCMSR